jgi:Flp pilus assembly secretin CpaC
MACFGSAALAAELSPIRPLSGAVREVPSARTDPEEVERTPVEQQPGLVVSGSPSYRITLRSGVATAISVGRVIKSVHIGDPKVVEFVPESDHTALLVPKAVGATNIDILDEKLQLINSLDIQVDAFPSGYQQVVIHNKAQLSSQTNFRCATDDCEYTGELTVQEPAVLPKGHTVQNINEKGGTPILPPTP